MSGTCGTRFPRLVERAFVRELPARQRRQLREHLDTCSSCREQWDRLAIVDRQMGGPRLDEATLERIGGEVVATNARRRSIVWPAAAMGVLASAALLFVVIRPDRGGETLTPRGTHSMGRTPGVRLFCVAGDADHVREEARMVSSGAPPELRCNIQDDLQIAYTTPDRKGLTMVAFARLDSTTIQYAPTSDSPHALALRADRVDELVDWSTRLSAEHQPGNYDVTVQFFDREVATRDAIAGRLVPVVELHARLIVTPRGGAGAN